MAIGHYLDGGNRAQVVQVYGPIEKWCVGQLTDFTAIFRDRKDFNEKLDGWDLSQAKTLREMFSGCTSFSQDLDWDVSNVEDMGFMFYDASSFDGSLASWKTNSLTKTNFMFTRATSFTGKGVEDWDMSNVVDIFAMFNGASAFQRNLCAWGLDLPEDVRVDNAFAESGCDLPITPDIHANPPGPFCFICV